MATRLREEQQVLRALSSDAPGLNAYQLSASTGLAPMACAQALGRLISAKKAQCLDELPTLNDLACHYVASSR